MKNFVMLMRVFAVIIYLGIALSTAEIYFRIFNPQNLGPVIHKADRVYGISMVPGLKGYLAESEFTHSFQLNSLGFRDKERSIHKSRDSYRIICLGDSISWGYGVKEGDTFIRKLENNLNRFSGGKEYEIFNWGVIGWGVSQQLLCLENRAFAYNPDLVILQYFKGNDLMDGVFYNLFRLNNDGKLMRVAYQSNKTMLIKRITNYLPFYHFFAQRSHLLNFIRHRLAFITQRQDLENIVASHTEEYSSYSLRLTESLLDNLFSLASEKGLKIGMVVFSDKSEISTKVENTNLTQKQESSLEDSMLMRVCAKYKIPMLILTDTLKKAQIDNRSTYYEKDIHPTPYGHEVSAQAIEEFLKQNQLL